MQVFSGSGCAQGIAFGKVLMKKKYEPNISTYKITDAEAEVALLDSSLEALSEQIDGLYEHTLAESGEEAAELIESYQMILCDKPFFDAIRETIREQMINRTMAIRTVCDRYRAVFMNMTDPYMRERYQDILELCKQLMMHCECGVTSFQDAKLTEPAIIIADTLTPMDTVKMDKHFLRGFVTEAGGATSHAVILAKTIGIPAIVGVEGITKALAGEEEAVISGSSGEVVIEPDLLTKEKYLMLQQQEQVEKQLFEKEVVGEIYTQDNVRILLAANVGDVEGAPLPSSEQCDGVGLFRTEFLYMQHQDYPDEEAQFKAYRRIVRGMEGKEVIFRTLDIGGDKALDYMGLPEEENPFLGYRAVRISLSQPDVFKTQLRAILRASAFGKAKMMFPMIVCYEELKQCLELLKQCKQELIAENIDFDGDISVGIMVETPAAVFILDQLADDIDFISIGTNDLVQYVTATDRGNPCVQKLYNPFHISVLRALRQIGDVACSHHIQVGVCGEAASLCDLVPFLVGCGFHELSVVPAAFAKMRYILRRLSQADCRQLVEKVCGLKTAQEAQDLLHSYVDKVMYSTI